MTVHQATPNTTNLVPLRPNTAPPTTGPQHLLTPPKQADFCKSLANHGNVRLACRAVQVSPQTVYRARRASPAFRQCWDAALVIAREHVEQVLADRAINGVEEKVFYHGEEVATRRRYDSRLLLAHLARLDRKADAMEPCVQCEEPVLGEHDFDAAVEALGASDQAGENGARSAARRAVEGFASGHCSMCSTLADDAVDLDEDCPELEARLCAMEAALPEEAMALAGMTSAEWWQAEAARLLAFEAGSPNWWCAR